MEKQPSNMIQAGRKTWKKYEEIKKEQPSTSADLLQKRSVEVIGEVSNTYLASLKGTAWYSIESHQLTCFRRHGLQLSRWQLVEHGFHTTFSARDWSKTGKIPKWLVRSVVNVFSSCPRARTLCSPCLQLWLVAQVLWLDPFMPLGFFLVQSTAFRLGLSLCAA